MVSLHWRLSLRFIQSQTDLINIGMQHHRVTAGFSLVEVLVVAVVTVIVFGALFASFKYSLDLINLSRAKLSSLAVANDRMEYFRSLPYDDVGVVSGYPSGTIPQTSVINLNGINFYERVRVDYVDDPADGLAAADTNGIILDYKQIRLEYTWNNKGATSSIQLLSNIVPRSIETTAGGGTARINVLDADASLLPGASVRLIGSSSTFPYDVTVFTDASGAALFNVPADSGYEVVVTGTISGQDYSTAQTYPPTVAIPNPVVAPFSVLEADVSTLTFQIGELSDLEIVTYSALNEGAFREEFTSHDASIASSSVNVSGGSLVLRDTLGTYDTSGYAYLGPITPTSLSEWQTVRVAATVPVNTAHRVHFYTGPAFGPYVLIPDSDLPGNAAGFTNTIIDLSVLEVATYPSISVGIVLETTDTAVSPEIDEVNVFYREGGTILANSSLDMRGDKVIGTDGDDEPVYKYDYSLQTDASGELAIPDLEFDIYTLTSNDAKDIAMACPAHPFVHEAGVDGELELVLVPDASDTLRVSVMDGLGRAIPGADVRLKRSGYDVTISTDNCGQAFFTGGVSPDIDYTIDVTATGYDPAAVADFVIGGDTVTSITLTE